MQPESFALAHAGTDQHLTQVGYERVLVVGVLQELRRLVRSSSPVNPTALERRHIRVPA